jgi:hypothetical protein
VSNIEFEIKEKVAEARVDLYRFREIMMRDWLLERAIKESTTIESNDTGSPNIDLIDYVEMGLDWGKIMDALHFRERGVMKVKFYKMKVKDMVSFRPGSATEDMRNVKLCEDRSDREEIMAVEDIIGTMAFSIKNFLKARQFNYEANKWDLVI